MKKKFLITTSIIALLYSVNVNAQSEFNETDIDSYISQRSVEVYLEADFTGTPYKDKMFKNGTILKNGVPLAKNIGLRYNASKDLFEVKNLPFENLEIGESKIRPIQLPDGRRKWTVFSEKTGRRFSVLWHHFEVFHNWSCDDLEQNLPEDHERRCHSSVPPLRCITCS